MATESNNTITADRTEQRYETDPARDTIVDAYRYLLSGENRIRRLVIGGCATSLIGLANTFNPFTTAEFAPYLFFLLLSAPAWGYFLRVVSKTSIGDPTPPPLRVHDIKQLFKEGIGVVVLFVGITTLSHVVITIVLGGIFSALTLTVLDTILGQYRGEVLWLLGIIFVYPAVVATYAHHGRLSDAVDPATLLRTIVNRTYVIGAVTAFGAYIVGVIGLLLLALLIGYPLFMLLTYLQFPSSILYIFSAGTGGFASFGAWVGMHFVIGRTWFAVQSEVLEPLPTEQFEKIKQLYAQDLISKAEYEEMSGRVEVSPRDAFEDLQRLYDSGVLTAAEYQSKKSVIETNQTAASEHLDNLYESGLLSKREYNRKRGLI